MYIAQYESNRFCQWTKFTIQNAIVQGAGGEWGHQIRTPMYEEEGVEIGINL